MSEVRGRPFAVKHGFARGNKSSTYRIWTGMKQRVKSKPAYTSKGIKVCDRWRVFQNFLCDMGERPSALHSIERINSLGNYEPANCKWATQIEQTNNQTKNIFVEAFGERKTVAQWARDPRCKTGYAGLMKRIHRGVAPKVAITTPNRKPCGIEE
jgi:hypothetical protein